MHARRHEFRISTSALTHLLLADLVQLIILQAVIYYIVTMILTKELVITTDQCTEYQFFFFNLHNLCKIFPKCAFVWLHITWIINNN